MRRREPLAAHRPDDCAGSGTAVVGTLGAALGAREVAVVERLHVHGNDRRDPRDDLADVVDPHDDEAALLELRGTGMHDRDARSVTVDRLLDAFVPDRVAGEVEVVEHEPAHRRHELGHAARPMSRRCPRDP